MQVLWTCLDFFPLIKSSWLKAEIKKKTAEAWASSSLFSNTFHLRNCVKSLFLTEIVFSILYAYLEMNEIQDICFSKNGKITTRQFCASWKICSQGRSTCLHEWSNEMCLYLYDMHPFLRESHRYICALVVWRSPIVRLIFDPCRSVAKSYPLNR